MAAYKYVLRMISIIIWKSWRIRRHRKWETLIEIAAPVLLVALLVSVKAVMQTDTQNSYASPETEKSTFFEEHDMKALLLHLCSIGCTTQGEKAYLAYTPNGTIADKIMRAVKKSLVNSGVKISIQGFAHEDEVEALNALLARNKSGFFNHPSSLTGAVVFTDIPQGVKDSNLQYKIRLSTPKFITGKIFPEIELPGPGKQFEVYENTGFLGLQMAVDRAFISISSGEAVPYKVRTQAFPYPPYVVQEKSQYTMILAILLPAAIIIGFTYLICNTVKRVSVEKQTGVKQFLTMLGLSNSGYWFSWFLDTFLVALISIILIIFVLCLDISGDGAAIQYSTNFTIFVFLLLYIIAALWFCFFVTTLISKSSYASSLGGVIWLGTLIVPGILVGATQRFLATQMLIAVLPNMCLFWGFRIIASWESRVIGIQWDNLGEYPNTTDSLNLALIFSMLVFNALFYMILTAFLHQAEPSSRKLKSPYRLLHDSLYDDTQFPEFMRFLKKGFKCKKKHKSHSHRKLGMDVPFDSPMGILRTRVLEQLGLIDMTGQGDTISSIFQESLVEKVDFNSRECGIKIRNLSKCYQTDTILRGINCDFYNGEISFILGKNGCGKTTLIQIMLGIVKAEEGNAYVNEYDIHDYKMEVRRSIGLCPQENMLFQDLTVMEHLLLFAYLKGKEWSQSIAQANHICNVLHLDDYSKTCAGKMSKPQQRMLCCAIALMGDPKVIIFDEPVRDMDMEGTKLFWSFLIKQKPGKTIIVTSHSISEAALIADRIAIISDGKLRCYGSPEYLHSVFGDGYTVKITVDLNGAEKLARMIGNEVPFAEIKNRVASGTGQDITLLIPNRYSPTFPAMFSQFFENREEFGISAINVDYVSVDEAFYS